MTCYITIFFLVPIYYNLSGIHFAPTMWEIMYDQSLWSKCIYFFQGECVGGWRLQLYVNMSSTGGIEQDTSLDDQRKCQAACLQTTTCLGIDFEILKKKCYFHTKTILDKDAQAAPNVNQYRRVSCVIGRHIKPFLQ